MKTITIDQRTFDALFERTLQVLELEKLRESYARGVHVASYEALHRKFHYEVCQLKSRLEES